MGFVMGLRGLGIRERGHEDRCFARKRAGLQKGRLISSSSVYSSASDALRLLEDDDAAEPLDMNQQCLLTLPGVDTPMTLGEALARIAAGNAGELFAVAEDDDEDALTSCSSMKSPINSMKSGEPISISSLFQRQPSPKPRGVARVETVQEEHEDEKEAAEAPRPEPMPLADAGNRQQLCFKPSVGTWLHPLPLQMIPSQAGADEASIISPTEVYDGPGSTISLQTAFAEEQEENTMDLMMALTSAADLEKTEQASSFKTFVDEAPMKRQPS
jgi:hypothetical protein